MRSFFQDEGVYAATVRAGNVIGGGDWAKDRLIPDAVRSWSMNESLTIKNQSFNFGPDSAVNKTVDEVLTEMSKSWENVKWKTLKLKENPKEAGLLKLSCDKAQHTINWFPTLTFEETLEFTMSWYKEFYSSDSKFNATHFTTKQIKKYVDKAKDKGLLWTI